MTKTVISLQNRYCHTCMRPVCLPSACLQGSGKASWMGKAGCSVGENWLPIWSSPELHVMSRPLPCWSQVQGDNTQQVRPLVCGICGECEGWWYVQRSASSVGQFCRVESQDEIPGSVHDVDMDFFVQSCFWGYDLVFRGYGRVNPKYKPTKGMTPWIWKVRWGGDTSNIGINRNEWVWKLPIVMFVGLCSPILLQWFHHHKT